MGLIILQSTLANTTYMIASSLFSQAHILWLLVSYASFSYSLTLVTISFFLVLIPFWFKLWLQVIVTFNLWISMCRDCVWLQHSSLNKSLHSHTQCLYSWGLRALQQELGISLVVSRGSGRSYLSNALSSSVLEDNYEGVVHRVKPTYPALQNKVSF